MLNKLAVEKAIKKGSCKLIKALPHLTSFEDERIVIGLFKSSPYFSRQLRQVANISLETQMKSALMEEKGLFLYALSLLTYADDNFYSGRLSTPEKFNSDMLYHQNFFRMIQKNMDENTLQRFWQVCSFDGLSF